MMERDADLAFVLALISGVLGVAEPSLPAGISGERLLPLIRRHRVGVAVVQHWRMLHERGAAPPIPEAIGKQVAAAQRQSLASVAFLLELARAYDTAGLDWMPIKGPVLGALAFGQPAGRIFGDLDVLVRPERQRDAVEIARTLGWRIASDWEQVERITGRIDLLLRPSRPGQPLLEIHSTLAGPHRGFAWNPLDDAVTRQALFGGYPLPCPDVESLIAYVAWHGAKHFWARLAWLVDVAALIRAMQPDPVRLMARARAMGAERGLLGATILSERLFGVPQPAFPAPSRNTARAAARIADWGERRITLPHYAPEVMQRPHSYVWALRDLHCEKGAWLRLPRFAGALFAPTEEDARAVGLHRSRWTHYAMRPLRLGNRLARNVRGGNRDA